MKLECNYKRAISAARPHQSVCIISYIWAATEFGFIHISIFHTRPLFLLLWFKLFGVFLTWWKQPVTQIMLDNWRLCFPKNVHKFKYQIQLNLHLPHSSGFCVSQYTHRIHQSKVLFLFTLSQVFWICVGTPLTFTPMFQKVQSFSSAYLEKTQHYLCIVEIILVFDVA